MKPRKKSAKKKAIPSAQKHKSSPATKRKVAAPVKPASIPVVAPVPIPVKAVAAKSGKLGSKRAVTPAPAEQTVAAKKKTVTRAKSKALPDLAAPLAPKASDAKRRTEVPVPPTRKVVAKPIPGKEPAARKATAKKAIKPAVPKAARKVPFRKPVTAKPAPDIETVTEPIVSGPALAPVREISAGLRRAAVPAVVRPPTRKAPAKIPPILLEGDRTESPPISGPGQRYSLGPTPPVEKLDAEGELPKAYGTRQLLLAARDPHWLYAHWDLTDEQQRHYNSLSADHRLVLRVHAHTISDQPEQEVGLQPDSRHWFVRVNLASTRYLAELGYHDARRCWTVIATSGATMTPPDAMAEDTSTEFATIPFEIPMAKLLSMVKEAVQENLPLAEALQEIRAEEHPELPEFPIPVPPAPSTSHALAPAFESQTFAAFVHSPGPVTSAARDWTPAQERALAELVSMDHVRRVWMGSMEITELIRRQVVEELASMQGAELIEQPGHAPTSPAGAAGAPGGISSPAGRAVGPGKGFWFNINAELIIYGATEADAAVTIAGRRIRLRPDGTFSYRFALPDGQYELPVVAVSADQTDGRAAELTFSRATEIRGDVGVHPQDPLLKRPEAASL